MIIMLDMPLTERFIELVDSYSLNYFEIACKFVVYISCFKTVWASNWLIVVLNDMLGLVSCRFCGKIVQWKENGCFTVCLCVQTCRKISTCAFVEGISWASKEIEKK